MNEELNEHVNTVQVFSSSLETAKEQLVKFKRLFQVNLKELKEEHNNRTGDVVRLNTMRLNI